MATRSRQVAILSLWVVLVAFPSYSSAQLLGALGGIEGVGEEATVATLMTMTGETNLKEGTGAVGIGYTYVRLTRQFGRKIELSSKEFGIPTIDFNRAIEATSRIFLIGYGVTSRFNIGASVPFAKVRSRLPLTPTGPAEEQESHGIGNIAVAAKYQFSANPNLAIRMTAQFPSGYEVGADFFQLAADVAYSVKLDRVSFHLHGGYLWNGLDRQDLDHLDAAAANLAVAQRIGDRFVGVLELNYQQGVGKDDLKDCRKGCQYLNPPTQMALDLTPGLKIQVKDDITAALAIRMALINTVAAGYDALYLFLVGYAF